MQTKRFVILGDILVVFGCWDKQPTVYSHVLQEDTLRRCQINGEERMSEKSLKS